MKRLFAAFLAILMLIPLLGCGTSKTKIRFAAFFDNAAMQADFEAVLAKRLAAFSVYEDQFSIRSVGGGEYDLVISGRLLSEREKTLLFSEADFAFRDYEKNMILNQNDIESVSLSFDLSLTEQDANACGCYLKIVLKDSGIRLLSEATLGIATLDNEADRCIWIYSGKTLLSQCTVDHRLMQSDIAVSGFEDEKDAQFALEAYLVALSQLPCLASMK